MPKDLKTDAKTPNNETPEKSSARNVATRKFVRRKRKRIPDSSDTENEEDIIDKAIDESIKTVAAKNAMTPDVVKKILKKLVLNEHVLAIVKLQEEEEESQERGETSKMQNTLKLTRAKARELNQKPFPITPYKNPEPDSEVTALIHNDIVSDDEDAEYEPNEDDIHSDDNTTISDVDSQPMTPATPKSCANDTDYEEAMCSYTEDGVFKIPNFLPLTGVNTIEDENIALRTRSKLCLQSTAIETIESTFIPPDITTDMYDFDADIDNVWKDFLTDFTKPMKTNNEEDDEADPEYEVCDNEVDVDEEELRQVRVSKKELSDLVTELFDMVGDIDETLLQDDPPLAQPIVFADKSPVTVKFQPSNASTPTIPYQISSEPPPPIFVQNPKNQNELIPIRNFDFVSNSYKDKEGIINLGTSVELESPNLTDDLKHVRIINTSLRKPTRVPVCNFTTPSKVNRPVAEDTSNAALFSNQQLKRLAEQMRIHVQFLTQNFVQTYAHPEHWTLANKFKTNLSELQKKCTHPESAFKACNLELAIQFCDEWEQDLLTTNDENTAMIQTMIKEVEKEKTMFKKSRRKRYCTKFPKKVMQTVITSKVFLYPDLLPPRPFRVMEKRGDLSHNEEYLIAAALDECHKKLKNILQKYQVKPRELDLIEVCREVVRTLCPFRTPLELYQAIRLRKRASYPMNPIKFYFIHNQAPALRKTEIINLDVNNIRPPLFYEHLLPPIWKQFRKRFKDVSTPNQDSSLWINSETKEIINESTTVKAEPENHQEVDISICEEDVKPNFADFSPIAPEPYPDLVYRSPIKSEQLSVASYDSDAAISTILHKQEPLDVRGCSCCNDCQKYKLEQRNQVTKQRHSKQRLRKFRPIRLTKKRTRKKHAILLKAKLQQFLLKSDADYDKENSFAQIRRRPLLIGVYKHIKAIDIYSSLLVDLKEMASKRTAADGPEAIIPLPQPKIAKVLPTIRTEPAKQPQKKYTVGTKRENNEDKDYVYAYNFYEKVEETLLNDNKIEEYEKFQNILKNFDHAKERVSSLFYRIEHLLAPNYPELVNLFLTFLLPGQAAEVGRFFEHFMVTNITTFLEKLHIYFNKQPSQIKKVLQCLTELSEDENVTIDQVKTRITPLLRGNHLLLTWFLELFPGENPTTDIDDLSDYETLHMNKKNAAICEEIHTSEVCEELLSTDITGDLVEPACGVRYINGRIMYGVLPKLLPAKLSFLTQESEGRLNRMSKPLLENDHVQCVHEIKQHGDRLLERDFNSSHSDLDEVELDQSAPVDEVDPQPSTSDGQKPTKKRKASDVKPKTLETNEELYVMCEGNVFKAHALRLNPHASGEKFEDFAHHLLPVASDDKSYFDDDCHSRSPKKMGSKGTHKQKPISPNTAKKSMNKSPNPTKRINFAGPPASVEPDATVKVEKSGDDEKPTEVEVKKDESQGWTRDEDRIILETIQNKICMTDDEGEILACIYKALENRRTDDIRQRYELLKGLFLKQVKSE